MWMSISSSAREAATASFLDFAFAKTQSKSCEHSRQTQFVSAMEILIFLFDMPTSM
jgi:hypothetical protein